MIDINPFLSAPVTAGAFRVLILLACRAKENREARYPVEDLAEDAQMCTRSAQRMINELVGAGLVDRTGSNRYPVYRLTTPVSSMGELVASLTTPVSSMEGFDDRKTTPVSSIESLPPASPPVLPPQTPPSYTPSPTPHRERSYGRELPTAPDRPKIDQAAEQRIRDHARALFGESVDGLKCIGYHAARSLAEYPEAWITEALTAAQQRGQSDWNYIRGILLRYHQAGGSDSQKQVIQFGQPKQPTHGGHTAATRPRPEREQYHSREQALEVQRRLAASIGAC